MQNRSRLHWWLLPPLLLLLIGLALYALTPRIAQFALQNWLDTHNFSAVTLNMRHPGWNTLHIEKLHMAKQEAGRTLNLTAENLRLRFNPLQLLLQQRLEHIQLSRAELQIQHSETAVAAMDTGALDLSRVLPSQWFDRIPVDLITAGEIRLMLDYPGDISDWLLTGALHFDHQNLTSRVQFQRQDMDLGWSDVKISSDDRLSVKFLQQNQPFFELDGQLFYQGDLKLSAQQHLELRGFTQWQQKFLNLAPELPEIEGYLNSKGLITFPLETRFNPDDLLLNLISEQTFKGELHLSSLANADKLSASVQGNLIFARNVLDLTLRKTSEITATDIRLEGLQQPVEEIQLRLPEGLTLKADLSALLTGQMIYPEFHAFPAMIRSTQLQLDGLEVAPGTIALQLNTIDLNNAHLTGRLSYAELQPIVPGQALPKFNLKAGFSVQEAQLNGSFNIDTDALPIHINGSLNSDLNQKHRFKWQLDPISLKGLDRRAPLYLGIPAELSLHAGTLFHNGTAHYTSGKFSAMLNNSIRNGSIRWEDYRFEGIHWDSHTRINTSGNIRDKGTIKLQQVKTGVDISNLLAQYQFDGVGRQQNLTVSHMAAELLEGTVKIEPVKINLETPDFTTTVKVDNVDLGQVLSLEQQEGLSGEGKLSGSFPVEYREGDLTIEDGGLFSLKPGGIIMFAPNPTVLAYAATNTGLKMALEALENFHFDTLDIKLDYRKDGTAHLNTRLKGSNPDWNNGHPVDFTINIEENIPKLLQALQFTEKLTKSIEKRYR